MLGRTDPSIPAVQALCIAPTRELARQIGDVVKQMGKFTQVTVYMAVKDSAGSGMMAHAQLAAQCSAGDDHSFPVYNYLASVGGGGAPGPVRDHIVIGTPGTVSDLLSKRRLDLRQLRVFAIDEADDMLDRQVR